MEWAAGSEVFAASFECYAAVYKADDIGAGEHFLDKWLGDVGCHICREAILAGLHRVKAGSAKSVEFGFD